MGDAVGQDDDHVGGAVEDGVGGIAADEHLVDVRRDIGEEEGAAAGGGRGAAVAEGYGDAVDALALDRNLSPDGPENPFQLFTAGQ